MKNLKNILYAILIVPFFVSISPIFANTTTDGLKISPSYTLASNDTNQKCGDESIKKFMGALSAWQSDHREFLFRNDDLNAKVQEVYNTCLDAEGSCAMVCKHTKAPKESQIQACKDYQIKAKEILKYGENLTLRFSYNDFLKFKQICKEIKSKLGNRS